MLNLLQHYPNLSIRCPFQDTFHEIERISPCTYKDSSIVYTWRLNERHYGSLVGLSKEEASRRMGEELVMEWRRSWDARPPPAEGERHTSTLR